jgi:hypothetical protein
MTNRQTGRRRTALGALALLSLIATGAKPSRTPVTAANPQVTITVNAAVNRHPIDPRIYGVAFANTAPGKLQDLGATINRWGGNATSRHNWFVNTTNRAKDYYFENQPDSPATEANAGQPGAAVDAFVTPTLAAGVDALITIPMMGILPFDSQIRCGYTPGGNCCQAVDGDHNCGNGRDANIYDPKIFDNKRLKNANNQNYFQPFIPQHQGNWVAHLKQVHNSGVHYYALDNEPSLWSFDHWDIHPNGSTMAEVWGDMATYGALIKQTDPNALTTGVEEWGWDGYFLSGADQEAYPAHPDRDAHNGAVYTDWLLQQAQKYEETNGTRILDFLTQHFYPQSGEFSNDDSEDSQAALQMQALRNESTRSLWDPNYLDKSYINDYIRLIPRMREWVNNNYPGTKIGLTEYNWGDEGDDTNDPNDVGFINGATAQADILGILGREGADMAVRWTAPPSTYYKSLVYNAFKMYRNYDGANGGFGNISVSDTSNANPDDVASFAAISSATGAMTVMIISKISPLDAAGGPRDVTVNFANYSVPAGATLDRWQLDKNNVITHLALVGRDASGNYSLTVDPQTITMLVATGSYAPSPTNLVATWVPNSTTVTVSWNLFPATTYHVWRKDAVSDWAEIGTATNGIFPDNSVTAGKAYLYRVQAEIGPNRSGFSNVDAATTFTFTDDLAGAAPPFPLPVVAIKAIHVNELRAAIEALRGVIGIAPGSYPDIPVIAGTTPVAVEAIRELRLSVNQARAWLSLPPALFTDPAINSMTTVKRQHIDDIRNAVR